jgi:hypothetical protein
VRIRISGRSRQWRRWLWRGRRLFARSMYEGLGSCGVNGVMKMITIEIE